MLWVMGSEREGKENETAQDILGIKAFDVFLTASMLISFFLILEIAY